MTGSGADLRALAASNPVHFMGVGGAGMCALAELLLRSGGRVTGCDIKASQASADLIELGAVLTTGHGAEHVADASALVITAAVAADHPEVLAARERGIPVLKRAEALGAWVNRGTLVAIAGTHGKTTTTAMVTEILSGAGLDPTGLVGGRVRGWAGNLRFGSDSLFIVEADEYDRSFHTLTPDVAVVTNVEADHLDVYGDYAGVKEGFATFLDGMRKPGRVIGCADDPGSSALLSRVGSAGYSYGLSAGSMLRGTDVKVTAESTSCQVLEEGSPAGRLTLPVGGLHNLRNALGAAAAARALNVRWLDIFEGLSGFAGVGRRFELLGSAKGVVLLDDYAHHPTEIRAALSAARSMYPDARLVVAFQPHLFSRTRDFAAEFGSALAEADAVWITDVFPAREAPLPGITGQTVVDAVQHAGGPEPRYVADLAELPEALAEELREGDLLVTLGAGSIESLGKAVLERLEAHVHA
jgi:UDP-N-acetylmuramate--alanine ligase